MADTNLIQPSFAAGELSPNLYGRVDLDKFHRGAAVMENFFVDYRGGASTRPGSQYIGGAYSGPVRLRRFVFSSNQTYILVFSHLLLEFIRNPLTTAYPNSSNAGFILSGASNYSVVTPYTASELPLLKFSQSADIMNITHTNHPRMTLSRVTDTNWVLTSPPVGASLVPPTGLVTSISAPPAGSTDPLTTTYMYTVTSISNRGDESNIAGLIYAHGLDMAITMGSVVLSWNRAPDAAYYRVYRSIAVSGNKIPSYGQQLGYIGYTYGTSFTDSNSVPDFTTSPPFHTNPFAPLQMVDYVINSPGSGYPNDATLISGPAGTAIFPIFNNTTWGGTGGIVGLYVIDPGVNLTTTAITATGAGGSGFSATAVIGPANQNPKSSAYFQQRLELASTPNNPVTIWGSKSGFYSNFDKSNPIVDNDSFEFTLAVQQVNAINWMIPMPGGLVLFTDAGVQQLSGGSTTAQNPLAVTPASAVMVPQSYYGANDLCEPIVINYDILYAQSEGSIIRDLAYNFFVNIYTGTDITLLSSHLFYPHTIVDWAYQDVPFKCIWAIRDDGVLLSLTYLKEQDILGWSRHSTYAGDLFESVAVIREGNADAVYFVVNRGGTRRVERLCGRDYSGGALSAWCLDSALSYSGVPTTVVTGLAHLNGRAAKALADGVPAGTFIVSGGAITLPSPASNVVVGLPFTCRLQTLYLDVGSGQGETVQSKRKKIPAMTARVKDTASIKMGTSFNTLTPFIPGVSSTDPFVWPSAPGLITGDMRMQIDNVYQVVGTMCIQQDNPLPATILAVIPEITVGG